MCIMLLCIKASCTSTGDYGQTEKACALPDDAKRLKERGSLLVAPERQLYVAEPTDTNHLNVSTCLRDRVEAVADIRGRSWYDGWNQACEYAGKER